MSTARKADLDALESFARAIATLKSAHVEVDVAELAELHDIAWPVDDDDDDDDDEPTAAELAEAHRQREQAALKQRTAGIPAEGTE